MPSTPDQVYKHEGWQGWGHWLGTGKVGVKKDQNFLPFKKALLYTRSLMLKSVNEWKAWCKRGIREANMQQRLLERQELLVFFDTNIASAQPVPVPLPPIVLVGCVWFEWCPNALFQCKSASKIPRGQKRFKNARQKV